MKTIRIAIYCVTSVDEQIRAKERGLLLVDRDARAFDRRANDFFFLSVRFSRVTEPGVLFAGTLFRFRAVAKSRLTRDLARRRYMHTLTTPVYLRYGQQYFRSAAEAR